MSRTIRHYDSPRPRWASQEYIDKMKRGLARRQKIEVLKSTGEGWHEYMGERGKKHSRKLYHSFLRNRDKKIIRKEKLDTE